MPYKAQTAKLSTFGGRVLRSLPRSTLATFRSAPDSFLPFTLVAQPRSAPNVCRRPPGGGHINYTAADRLERQHGSWVFAVHPADRV